MALPKPKALLSCLAQVFWRSCTLPLLVVHEPADILRLTAKKSGADALAHKLTATTFEQPQTLHK